MRRPRADTEQDTWPEPYQHYHPPDPTASIPSKGMRMRVMNGRDPHAGQVGRVQRVTFDAGDLLCTLAFDDGTRGDYWLDELLMKA